MLMIDVVLISPRRVFSPFMNVESVWMKWITVFFKGLVCFKTEIKKLFKVSCWFFDVIENKNQNEILGFWMFWVKFTQRKGVLYI